MNQRIEELLDKYWAAGSSLAEEQELKELLLTEEGYQQEKEMFLGLKDLSSEEPNLKTPVKIIPIKPRTWISWAASVAILMGTAWGWTVYEQKQAEEQAYMEVMQAFALIQTNLSRGQEEMNVMSELRYLNTTNQLFGKAITK
ncbi:hypothetical protein LV84_00880 [Algoriphagus ratkowskyi]|uniref:Uncharacterized protein n=1 Tax=Algoriphagus ratkowskyi TaxID=57028 RepID=A0A2W7RHI5_9BACT|nr:hypothetical protein [Algoriphagus ratkowskyi]PZX59671.1 hypothetical protein LV84_00880 [Algoriphagus ratkowskyi]TXD78611.1 hypothetical protein ESW18_07415 [Algoriphagus ratkowskyi]